MVVSFKDSIDVTLLEGLKNVDSVNSIKSNSNQNRYQINFNQNSNSQDNSTDVYQLTVKQGWELIELSPQNETLEKIFMDLVYSESDQSSVQKENSEKEIKAEGVNE